MDGHRSYRYDNIKALLMLCVVFGHMQNLFSGRHSEDIFRTLYIFHIPAFIFIMGRFASFSPWKLLKNQLLPYLVFQVLYITGDHLIRGDPWELQWTTPRWLLWFLLASAFWRLLIPFLKTERRWRMAATLLASVLLALAAGYCSRLGFYLTLSRVVVFLPFFLLGLYLRQESPAPPSRRARLLIGAGAAAGTAALTWLLLRLNVTRGLLYGALSYASGGGGPALRALQLLAAACWTLLLLCLVPDAKLPVISTVGRNTMLVFLLHGFPVRAMERYQLFSSASEWKNMALALVLSITLLLLFGNNGTRRLADAVCAPINRGFSRLEKTLSRKKSP